MEAIKEKRHIIKAYNKHVDEHIPICICFNKSDAEYIQSLLESSSGIEYYFLIEECD